MKTPLIAALLAAMPLAAGANEFAGAMQSYFDAHLATWADDPVLVAAVRDRNAVTAGFDQATIDAMDLAWRAEVGAGSTPTIDPVLSHAAADVLRERVAASGGAITEVIVMDGRGLNAAISHVTSDMWQGDEAKYQQTYARGPGALHFSEIERDESSGRYQAQISFTLVDPASGEPVGAVTVGVDAEALL